jgi:hypothetical protein
MVDTLAYKKVKKYVYYISLSLYADHSELPDQGGFVLSIPLENNRHQEVELTIVVREIDFSKELILTCKTFIGKAYPYINFMELLRKNSELNYSKIVVIDNDLALVGILDIEETTSKKAIPTILEVARVGDSLEEELFGYDDY